MKTQKHIRNLALATSIAALLATPASHAANYYWDSNGTGTAGAGITPTGIWGIDAFWSTDLTGANVGSPVLTAITTSADDVFFSAGTDAVNAYTIGLDSTEQYARLVTFEDGTVTLNDGTLVLENGGITVSSTAVTGATINSGLTISGSQTFNVATGGSLTLGGATFTRNTGATLNVLSTGTVTTTMTNLNTASLVNNIIGRWASFGSGNSTTYATIDGSNNIVGLGYTGGADGTSAATANNFTSATTNYTFSTTGTTTLSAARTANTIRYTGTGNTIDLGASGANTLTLNGILAAGASGTLTIQRTGGTGTVVIGNSNELVIAGPQDVTISAPISGASGFLNYSGTGNLTLSGANTYVGTTRITAGTLNATASGSLGNGSATNTLIFNGGTLRATGAINSPAARGVDMAATGIIDTNGQAISIAGNITGAGGLTKNGAGTLTLSGTSSYGGVTTVNVGTLAITKEVSLASNTAANLNVKSGAILRLNVDSAGTAGFTSANLSTLLGNISVANTAAQGLQAGAMLALDTGATFTQGNAITDSTGASGGAISLTKLGAGTLVLDKTNTYTGATTITAGTLQLNAGGVIATPILNNSAFAVNSAGTVTQGTDFGLISGTGTLTKTLAGTLTLNLANTFTGTTTISAGTLTLSNALALQNSALVTTSGTSTLSGITTLTLGGLSGATGNLATVLSGYTGNITALTLNPQSGVSVTYDGVIANGAAGMTLTKTGAGTQTLNGVNTYTGATTISEGILNAAATGSLGNGSATNTLIFNGGTLRATGTITSPAARGVTMTSTGIINNNGQAISIAGNITGAGGLTKNGAGTLTLSGTNSYGGVTTVNAGTLAITKEVALASNTAANLNVKSGVTLQLNVGGAGEFTTANLGTLLGNISVANTAAQGLQGGVTLALDTTNAGGSFTPTGAITNSTGAFGGATGLTKLGTGTLVLDQANTYTGVTTISAGTLQLGNNTTTGSLSASNQIGIGTGATFTVNQTDTVTQGTDFGFLVGAGGFTQAGSGTTVLNQANTFSGLTTITAGTLSLANALALRNSALVTTTGTSTMGAFSALTIGGLSGSRDLGSADVLNGYTGNVSALTLNPATGVSVTYSGIISNGTGAMSLTKTGGGTQTLTGANTYTGATIVNGGTLTIGVNGSLNSSSALQINGGTFSYGNTAAGQTMNGLAVGVGNATVSNTAAGQTLALGAIDRTAGLFGRVDFATLTGPISTTTGNANSIIGPWATTGTTTALRYAVGSADGSTATNISAFTTGTTATANTLANVTDATVNYEYSAAVAAMPASTALTGNTLRYSGATTTTVINTTSTLTLNGLMNAMNINGNPITPNILTISNPSRSATPFILIGSTGELVITSNSQTTIIGAVIGGTGRLVYSGAGTLRLGGDNSFTPPNTYTGGTVINSGTLELVGSINNNVNAMLGNASGGITLNGGRLKGTGVSIIGARDVTVNGVGSQIDMGGSSRDFTTTGKLTGAGTLGTPSAGNYNFNSTANDFTGRFTATGGIITVNSFADGANNIALDGATFNYGTGANAPANLASRAIELSGTTGGATINNNNTASSHANTLTFGGGVVTTGVGNKTLTLGGANTGNNTISGSVTDGPGSVISLTKAGAGTWVLSAANTYTGATSITGGRLQLGSGTGTGSLSTGSRITVGAGATFAVNQTDTVTQGTDFSGAPISGTGNFSQTGSGTTVLTAANTFSGTTTISGGTLKMGNATALGFGGIQQSSTGSTTVSSGATLDLNGSNTIHEPIILSGTGIGGNGALINNSGTTAIIGNGIANLALPVLGTGTGYSTAPAVTITGAGTGATATASLGVTAATFGAITYGANVTTATAVITGGGGSGATATINPANGAITITNPGTGYTSAPTITATVTGGGSITYGASNTNNFTVSGLAITGAGSGYTGTPTYTFSDGNASAAAVTGTLSSVNLAEDSSIGGSGNITINAVVSESGGPRALTKTGIGTLALTGANTYTGTTTVSGGTLEITGSISGSEVVVNGGTLSGNGGTTGAVTVAIGGTIAPGSSIGTLNTGALAFTGGAFGLEINTTAITSDLANVAGNLSLAGGATLNITDFNVSGTPLSIGQVFTFIDYSGTWDGGVFAGRADDSQFTLGLNDYRISYNGVDNATSAVTLQVVPEPGSAVLLLGGLAALVGIRRRRA